MVLLWKLILIGMVCQLAFGVPLTSDTAPGEGLPALETGKTAGDLDTANTFILGFGGYPYYGGGFYGGYYPGRYYGYGGYPYGRYW